MEGNDITVREDNSVVVNLRSEALFNSGRARLSTSGRNLMGRVATALEELDNDIVVEGHTDSIPVSGSLAQVFPSNWELSVARRGPTRSTTSRTGAGWRRSVCRRSATARTGRCRTTPPARAAR